MANRNKKVAQQYSGKNNKGYKDRKYNDRDHSSCDEDRDYEKQKKSTNDVDWYFRQKETFEQTARVSFNNFLGRPVIDTVKIPTIATILTNPSVGISVKYDTEGHYERSGLNLASQKLFTKLNIYSGRNAKYGPQDVGVAIGAMAEVVSYFEYLRRAFGIVLFYNERNRDIPTRLLEAMGIDPDDFYDKQANYRKKFNKLVQSIDQLPLIMNITYMKKAMFMYQRVYTDSESLMAQMYMFVPATTWMVNETMLKSGTVLETIPAACALGDSTVTIRTMGSHLSTLSQMIEALLNSGTLNDLYADIYNLAAKTSDIQMFKMDILTDDYSVSPVYDPMVNLQVHNLDIVGVPKYPRSGSEETEYVQRTPLNDVVCNADSNSIVYNPAVLDRTADAAYYPATRRSKKLLDFKNSNPSPTEIAEATRLSAFAYPGTPAADLVDELNRQLRLIYTVGDHYVTSVIVSGAYAEGSGRPVLFSSNNAARGTDVNENIAVQIKSAFTDFPIFYEASATEDVVTSMNGEVDFCTTVDREWLDGVNDVILLDMFNLR